MVRAHALLVLAAVLLGLAAATVVAAIDFTGDWLVRVHGTSPFEYDTGERWTVVQTGTQLAVRINGGSPHGGFIDASSGDFQIDLGAPPASPFPCPNGTITGTVAPDGRTFSAHGVSYFFHGTPPVGCFTAEADLAGARTPCGNGTVDQGEECDDGNVLDGDCCSSTCRLDAAGVACGGADVCGTKSCDGAGACQDVPASVCGTTCRPGTCAGGTCVQSSAAAGTPCDTDGDACTTQECDGSGGCAPRSLVACGACQVCDPIAGCVDGTRSSCTEIAPKPLHVQTGDPAGHALAFGLHDRGLVAYLGDPADSTSYGLCVFDTSGAAPRTLVAATAPAGGTCAGKPCWKAIRGGYKYRDPDHTPDGIAVVNLRATPKTGTAAKVRSGGPNLLLPPTFAGVTSVVVQVIGDECLEARYGDVTVAPDGATLRARP